MKKEEKHITKNLANCTPREFLKQTNRVRKCVEAWLTATDILNIRRELPDIPDGANEEEKQEAQAAQMKKNLSAMLDAILDEHPDETLELLALMCFVEPDEADDYPIGDYLDSLSQMIGNQAVIRFFMSLASWGRIGISG